MKTISNTRYITTTAILAAIASILMFLDFPIIPGFTFLQIDFSAVPALVSSFSLGPISGLIVCFIQNTIKLAISESAFVGELCNFILESVVVVTAGIMYKYKKTRNYAFLGATIGSIIAAVLSLLTNYFVIYPMFFGATENALGMYKSVFPFITNMWGGLAVLNMPFTFVKFFANSLITFVIYKPLSKVIKQYHTKKKPTENTETFSDDLINNKENTNE